MAHKKTPAINGGSMADISFLILVFFLMVSTMDSEKGLQRRLPPMPQQNQKAENQKVNRRNIIQVKVSASDHVFAGDEPIENVSELGPKVIEFLTNPNNLDNLSEKKTENIEGFGPCQVSQGVISLQNDRGTSYKKYIEVQNELVKAVNTIRDQFAMANFGKPYERLDEDKQEIVRKAVPQKISEAEPKDVKRK
ncbi:MAG: biopolymer transporter ExbD [Bacteroidales bacterium]|jgi:biopolymer transport protein ExbD|nr:biopolymer transporter ExbD [Bacteroidales bacterium]MCI2121304.1 biopolymer transporter ExbD [Bacteroidales bacterium]MCI2145206.1 biopolymer transporter ExbD [Bacteroidales bacterium]